MTPTPPPPADAVRDDEIKHMVQRFLSWRLPESFNPDGGVKYRPYPGQHTTGTNLFDATQAEAMVRHMVGGLAERVAQNNRRPVPDEAFPERSPAPRDDGDAALIAAWRLLRTARIPSKEAIYDKADRLADRLEALTRPTSPSDEAAFEALRQLIGKHLGPYLAIAPTPRYEAVVYEFIRAFLAARASTTAGGAEDAEAQCERAVGRFIYNRVSALMDAKAGTPEGVELAYLAQIVTDVEEYGADGSEPREGPVQAAPDGDAVCTTCRWKGNHSPDCPRKDEPWPPLSAPTSPPRNDGAGQTWRDFPKIMSALADSEKSDELREAAGAKP